MHLLFQCLPSRFHLGQKFFTGFAGRLQLLLGLLGFLCLSQQGRGLFQLFLQAVQYLLLLLLGLTVLGNQLTDELHSLRERQPTLLSLLKGRLTQVVLVTDHSPNVLLYTGPGSLAVPLKLSRFVLHPLLKHHIVPGLEDLPKNFLTAFGICQQQLHKISLCDHGDLGKLASVQANDIHDLPVDLPGFDNHTAIGKDQLCLGLLRSGPSAPFGGTFILRIAAHSVGLASVGENQFHLGRGVRLGVLGAEHGWIPVLTAGLSIERVGNGIKNRSLSRAGIPSNQVKPLLSQLLQVHNHFSGIGAKGRYSQF